MIGKDARIIEVGWGDWTWLGGWEWPPLESFGNDGASFVVAIASFLVVLALISGSQR